MNVNFHLAEFGGHRQCGNGDIMILNFCVILQDHLIKRSCDLKGKR